MCIMSQKVSDIASRTNVICLRGSISVNTAMEVMDMYEIDIVAVECEKDFAGIFSRADFTRTVVRQNLDPNDTTLYEAMTINPPSVEPESSIRETYEVMLTHKQDYIPVIKDRKLYGIVSMKEIGRDIVKSYDNARTENSMIRRYIQGGESYGLSSYGLEVLEPITAIK